MLCAFFLLNGSPTIKEVPFSSKVWITWLAERPVLLQNDAIPPVTCGVAIDVPLAIVSKNCIAYLINAVLPFRYVDRIAKPGA